MRKGGPRKNRIPPVSSTRADSRIPSNQLGKISNVTGNCSFSLKYLKSDDTFKVAHEDSSFYHTLIERLQALSSTSVSDLLSSRSTALRCHPIEWSDSRVSRDEFGIPREDEICDKPYQISISKANGRIHGFFTGDIFNIVWFDKDHALYPGKGK